MTDNGNGSDLDRRREQHKARYLGLWAAQCRRDGLDPDETMRELIEADGEPWAREDFYDEILTPTELAEAKRQREQRAQAERRARETAERERRRRKAMTEEQRLESLESQVEAMRETLRAIAAHLGIEE